MQCDRHLIHMARVRVGQGQQSGGLTCTPAPRYLRIQTLARKSRA